MGINADHEDDLVVSALSELCLDMEIKCLIQVGAGDAHEACMVKEKTGCRAIAIEANIGYSSCSPTVEYHHLVIWSSNGQQNFYINSTPGLSGHFPRNDGKEQMVYVQNVSLESFCKAGGGIKPDALIIDTEGSTMEVLEGCGDMLDGVRLVYAEVQNGKSRPGIRTSDVVCAFMDERGFSERAGPPSYDVGSQANLTWVRK